MNNFVLKGICMCNFLYVGVDCLYVKIIFFFNLILLDGGLCKNIKWFCKEINIFGYF